MAAPRKVLLASAALALLAGAVSYQAQRVARQGAQLDQARERRNALARQLAAAQKRNLDEAAALAELQRQLEDAEATAKARAESPIETETRAWLVQLGRIRKLFADRPEASIPELQLLDLRAWLGATKGAQLDTDEHIRQSLAAIRNAAKMAFTQQCLAQALGKYVNTRNGELPATVLELGPYFNPPIDAAILERYKMNRTGNLANLVTDLRASDAIILEKIAADEEFDTRAGVNAGRHADGTWGFVPGSFGGPSPAAWIDDYQDRLKRAQADFTREHPGTKAAGLADVVSYMNPPLDPAVAEKLIKAEKARPK